jgi:hypothetical protein
MTLAPSLAASLAQDKPPDPPPITIQSASNLISLVSEEDEEDEEEGEDEVCIGVDIEIEGKVASVSTFCFFVGGSKKVKAEGQRNGPV